MEQQQSSFLQAGHMVEWAYSPTYPANCYVSSGWATAAPLPVVPAAATAAVVDKSACMCTAVVLWTWLPTCCSADVGLLGQAEDTLSTCSAYCFQCCQCCAQQGCCDAGIGVTAGGGCQFLEGNTGLVDNVLKAYAAQASIHDNGSGLLTSHSNPAQTSGLQLGQITLLGAAAACSCFTQQPCLQPCSLQWCKAETWAVIVWR
jgi:hypothetical protein